MRCSRGYIYAGAEAGPICRERHRQTDLDGPDVLRRRRGAGRPPAGYRRDSAVRRPGGDRLCRLCRSWQFRHQHPGRCPLCLWPAVGRDCRQPAGDAVPGDVGQAWHRHRPQPGGAKPGAFPPPGGARHVAGQRGRRDGDRSGGVPWRRDRADIAAAYPAALGHGGHRCHHLRDSDARPLRVPSHGAGDRRPGGADRRQLCDRVGDRPARLGRGGDGQRDAAAAGCRGGDAGGRHHRRHRDAACDLPALRPDPGAHAGPQRHGAAAAAAVFQSRGGGGAVGRRARSTWRW